MWWCCPQSQHSGSWDRRTWARLCLREREGRRGKETEGHRSMMSCVAQTWRHAKWLKRSLSNEPARKEMGFLVKALSWKVLSHHRVILCLWKDQPSFSSLSHLLQTIPFHFKMREVFTMETSEQKKKSTVENSFLVHLGRESSTTGDTWSTPQSFEWHGQRRF